LRDVNKEKTEGSSWRLSLLKDRVLFTGLSQNARRHRRVSPFYLLPSAKVAGNSRIR
jgi:hypothetical protein